MCQQIEAIKLAAGSVQYQGISVISTMVCTVEKLYNWFEQFKDTRYLETAILHIQAFLEMGFVYEEAEMLFDQVLQAAGTSREKRFPRRYYTSKKIKLNRSQVRNIIGKWPSSPQQEMKIDEVVADIMRRVEKREAGIVFYECIVAKTVYELVINENEIFFHDIKGNKFYTFDLGLM